MSKISKPVQCQNTVKNHQNRETFLVLDLNIEEYETTQLYQWEMSAQFFLCGVTNQTPTVGFGNK
eukprot:4447948-Ditylum_brightwellii.AAC.1